MTRILERLKILEQINELNRRDPQCDLSGADGHEYKLNPPLSVSVMEAFEKRHGVSLPEDYRFFITEIANGGAGPSYGVFPFGKQTYGSDLHDWEAEGLVGDLSKPFRHTSSWNFPKSFWDDAPASSPGTSLEADPARCKAWFDSLGTWYEAKGKHYWNRTLMNGAIPICHQGCGYLLWLVIHGQQRGFVWNDIREARLGIVPLLDKSGQSVTFSDWYMDWLDASLREVGNFPRSTAAPLWL